MPRASQQTPPHGLLRAIFSAIRTTQAGDDVELQLVGGSVVPSEEDDGAASLMDVDIADAHATDSYAGASGHGTQAPAEVTVHIYEPVQDGAAVASHPAHTSGWRRFLHAASDYVHARLPLAGAGNVEGAADAGSSSSGSGAGALDVPVGVITRELRALGWVQVLFWRLLGLPAWVIAVFSSIISYLSFLRSVQLWMEGVPLSDTWGYWVLAIVCAFTTTYLCRPSN
ncbi:hypothetical protein AURDEDRAFT_126962 [Auricularia subglabra TFB-10046 SS5]|nr:hypothetical protein AURDEDRAFT_126962 [Auricularia subglabra TFB-10046 SS5]